MASSNKASAAEHPTGYMASGESTNTGQPHNQAVMDPLLLVAASSGDCERLKTILNWGDAPWRPPSMEPQVVVEVPVEGPAAELLLEGVTPQGDTALHAIALSLGSSEKKILDSVYAIYNKAKHLLDKANNAGDTPLHCAARTGKCGMVAYLIYLAKSEQEDGESREKAKALLRKQNTHGETALHEAIRAGREDIVILLLTEDSELARISSKNGTSPLYMAIQLGRRINIVETLYEKDNHLSYSGPDGKNALHAAVIAGKVFTKRLVGWNKDLATGRDAKGSTPLHFAAGLGWRVCRLVLEANMAALHRPDNDGCFPIHVAASVGAVPNISLFITKCPSSAGLRDSKGRTFLHVAVENNKRIFLFSRYRQDISWIMNMQDNDGNTALHLAVQAGKLVAFSALFRNRQVELNLTNSEGQTPLDIARCSIPPWLYFTSNNENLILRALEIVGAKGGVSREDHLEKKRREDIHKGKSEYEKKTNELVKETTETLSIGSVLVATVTFGVTFALPGGYRADDHPNGGTPTLAGRYTFDAFMMADTVAFVCSALATVGFMYSGSPIIHMGTREGFVVACSYLMQLSITALTAAFALGVYMVLSPVAPIAAIWICALSAVVMVSTHVESWIKRLYLLPGLCVRKGPLVTFVRTLISLAVSIMFLKWPLIFIFGWAAYSNSHSTPRLEPTAQPPVPLT